MTVLFGYLAWKQAGGQGRFSAYLVPSALYRHASTRVDMQITLFNLLFVSSGVVAALAFTPVVTFWLLGVLNGLAPANEEA